MHPLCLVFTLLGQSGPKLPALKGLRQLPAFSAWAAQAARSSVQEIGGGAVVVVEDVLPVVVMPELHTGLRLLGGKLQLFNRDLPQPGDLPITSWMDPNTVYSGGTGGNVVARTYPIGWGY